MAKEMVQLEIVTSGKPLPDEIEQAFPGIKPVYEGLVTVWRHEMPKPLKLEHFEMLARHGKAGNIMAYVERGNLLEAYMAIKEDEDG